MQEKCQPLPAPDGVLLQFGGFPHEKTRPGWRACARIRREGFDQLLAKKKGVPESQP
jgi:hypothetical protein